MAKPNPETLFVKHVVNTLLTHGQLIDQVLVDTVKALPADKPMRYAISSPVDNALLAALTHLQAADPARAAQLFIDMHAGLRDGMFPGYVDFLLYLHQQKNLFWLTPYLGQTEDGRYALATTLLIFPHDARLRQELAEGLSAVCSRPITLNTEAVTWMPTMLTSMFGPVWTELYANKSLLDREIVQYVWLQRPPFIEGFQPSLPDVDLPAGLAP